MFRHSIILNNVIILLFFIAIFTNTTTTAQTLKSMAEQSTILLALSENQTLMSTCKLNTDHISKKSMSLKMKIDSKIEKLSENDLAILDTRSLNCEQDCSCTIYSLAFDAKNKYHKMLSDKATKVDASARLNCIKKIKNYCKKIDLL